MDNLKVIENELVPVYVTSTGEKVVYGTELHAVLEVKSKFADWVKNRLDDCEAVENKDFETFSKILEKGRPSIDYIIKLNTAKEMAMLERNEKGKQVRRYFIRIEEKYQEAIVQKKEKKPNQEHIESLSAANTAVKTITPMLVAAGCPPQIQLLTAKAVYRKAGLDLPIEIQADKHYVDTTHIARHVGLYYQTSGKPADKAVNEIIRRLQLPESMYTETWESKGNWQGAVRKYDEAVIDQVKQWYCENGYPRDIEYTQTDGKRKAYHVIFREAEVA